MSRMNFNQRTADGRPTVAIGGLGAIGLVVAEALDRDPGGARLVAVCAADRERARSKISAFQTQPAVVEAGELAQADIVVEAAPAAAFDEIVVPAIEKGRTIVIVSVAALLPRMHLVDQARRTGARLVVASGALAGLDAIRAAAEGAIENASLETRKSPASLAGAPFLQRQGIDVHALTVATCVFKGNALEAAAGFPANANVAAALALAGIGPERTRVEIWADPLVERNTHTVRIDADCARLTLCVESVPSRANPRTSRLAALSVLACIRGMTSSLKIGG
jgi:aspartate dehydrogenase